MNRTDGWHPNPREPQPCPHCGALTRTPSDPEMALLTELADAELVREWEGKP